LGVQHQCFLIQISFTGMDGGWKIWPEMHICTCGLVIGWAATRNGFNEHPLFTAECLSTRETSLHSLPARCVMTRNDQLTGFQPGCTVVPVATRKDSPVAAAELFAPAVASVAAALAVVAPVELVAFAEPSAIAAQPAGSFCFWGLVETL